MRRNRKKDSGHKNTLNAIEENNLIMIENISHLNETIEKNNQDMYESIMNLSEAIKESS